MILQIVSFVGLIGLFGALAWIGKRTFELGKMVHRLDTVEENIKKVEDDVKNLDADIKDMRKEFNAGLAGLNTRIDSLMLAITKAIS